jgi:predicted secreted protein
MHHDISLDGDEILSGSETLQTQEMQANAFASEFLIPRWLLALHGKAQGWSRQSLEDPAVVYQLALRVGASYEALLVALRRQEAIDAGTLMKLRAVQPKTIKQQLLPGYQPNNWFRDVWLLTQKDEGTVIEGQPDDIFIFRLNEKSSAGYLWDIDELKKQGFAVVRDTRDLQNCADGIGGPVERRITAQSENAKSGEVVLPLRRPWEKAASADEELHVRYDLRGKEYGLPRALRRYPAVA